MLLTGERPEADALDPDVFDLLDARTYAYGDPHALWAWLRRSRPVHRHEFRPGAGFWLVTRHADVTRVLRDHEDFSSRQGTLLSIIDAQLPDIATDLMMPDTDPPLHGRLREPVARALAGRTIQEQEPRLRRITAELLAPALDGEVFDLAAAAMMFPMAFTGSLMGVPRADWARMARLTTTTIAYDDPDYAAGTALTTLRTAHHELFGCFADEIGRRGSGAAGDDIIDILLSMSVHGMPLTEEQALFNCYAVLLGANVTTPHALSGTVQALIADPRLYREVAARPELLGSCVEEGLRWTSPAMHFMRHTTRDVRFGDVLIPAGQPVTAWLGSANRDDAVFTDPFRFDPARTPNRHVAFGFGPHYCVGAGLARLALRVFLDELFRAVEHIEPAGPVRHLESNFVAGLKSFPVRMVPRAAS